MAGSLGDPFSAAPAWLAKTALPLWAERGVDRARGGFHERLRADGAPDLDAPKRVRAQARQVFVFAEASRRGWFDGLALAERGAAFLLEKARPNAKAYGYARLLHPDGSIADPALDAYDQVFVIFAFAALYEASGETSALEAALSALAHLEAVLGERVHGGFHEARPARTPRRQNPHMHAFETFMKLFEAVGDEAHLDRAHDMFALFTKRFFDPRAGALREYFNADWSSLEGEAGECAEPGHEMEWVWLLEKYAGLTGVDVEPWSARLFAHAHSHGRDRATGFLLDEISLDGAPRRTSRRLWPQTEYLKALCARHRAGDTSVRAEAQALLTRLFADYLDRPVPGAWIDQYGPDGSITNALAPASTLYHLIEAFGEIERTFTVSPAA